MANIGNSPAKRARSSSSRQGWNRAGAGTPSPRSLSSQWTRKNSGVSPLTRWVFCRRPGGCATCRGFATRIMEADEMARAILFPADPSATYFAGADLDVTGDHPGGCPDQRLVQQFGPEEIQFPHARPVTRHSRRRPRNGRRAGLGDFGSDGEFGEHDLHQANTRARNSQPNSMPTGSMECPRPGRMWPSTSTPTSFRALTAAGCTEAGIISS